MEIGKYIKELLFIHDCVIIPGLGGFVANYRPAEVNELTKSISPPSKSILFNRNLVHNDGLLIGYVAQKTGSDYTRSEEIVKEFADRIGKSVSDGKKFPLDEIGFFYADSQRRLQFQDEAATNFLLASYGLTTVHFEPVEKEKKEVVPEVVYRSDGTMNRTPVMNLKRWIYTGVAASLVAAMVLIPVKTGYIEHMNFGWLNRESSEQVIEHDQTTNPVSADTETTFEPTPLNFHIIVGSFKNFANARKLRTQLSETGHGSKIMEASNGYYRVAIHTAGDAAAASDELSKVRQMDGFEKAWILKE